MAGLPYTLIALLTLLAVGLAIAGKLLIRRISVNAHARRSADERYRQLRVRTETARAEAADESGSQTRDEFLTSASPEIHTPVRADG